MTDPRIRLAGGGAPKRNRLTAGTHLGFNLTANFKNVGGAPVTSNPGPSTGGGVDRFYDDGFVGPPAQYPNNNGQTFYWGYDSSMQLGATDLFFHSASAPGSDADSKGVGNDPQYGVDLTYAREIGALSKGAWGLELGAAYTDLSLRDTRTRSGAVSLITDSYALSFPPNLAPAAPYGGPPRDGMGPTINESPVRTVAPESAVVSGRRSLEASVYGLRLGPYYRLPLSERVAVQLSAGLSAAVVDSTFSYSETTSTMAGGAVTRAGRSDRDDVLVGGYVAGQLSVALGKNVDVFAGAQYQNLGNFSHKVAGKEADVRFNNAVFVNVGLGFSF